ncbi:MAG: hypothetical protein HY517_04750 [Candidatus Aenigmarchaeota archaeon]|nr:hypothetical protein [Candidatus Aenigmarchaeota archaeon]
MQYASLFNPFNQLASVFHMPGTRAVEADLYPRLGKEIAYMEGTPEYLRAVRAAMNRPEEGERGIRDRGELTELADKLRTGRARTSFEMDLLRMFEYVLEKTQDCAVVAAQLQ